MASVKGQLIQAVRSSNVFNPEVQVAPACILWPDRDRQCSPSDPSLTWGGNETGKLNFQCYLSPKNILGLRGETERRKTMMNLYTDNSVIINKAHELGASLAGLTPVKALKALPSYQIYAWWSSAGRDG